MLSIHESMFEPENWQIPTQEISEADPVFLVLSCSSKTR